MLGGSYILILSHWNRPWVFPSSIGGCELKMIKKLWKLKNILSIQTTSSHLSFLYIQQAHKHTTVVFNQTKSELSVGVVVSVFPLHPLMFSCCLCIFISLSPSPFEVINNFKCVWCIKDIWKSLFSLQLDTVRCVCAFFHIMGAYPQNPLSNNSHFLKASECHCVGLFTLVVNQWGL